MPIAPVDAPVDASRQPAATPPPVGADFAAALAAAGVSGATRDPASLPSVRLGEMVDALASQGAPGAAAGALDALDAGAVQPSAGVRAESTPAGSGGSAAGARVLSAGERYLGVPYLWGGTDPDKGFDCSGFVQRVFSDVGVSLPRVSIDQSRAGTAVAEMAQARPGDLVFWNGDGSRPNHIGIYAGEGRMLVAPSSGDVVRYQDITREPHRIRRVL